MAVARLGERITALDDAGVLIVDGDGGRHHHPVRVTAVERLVDEDVEFRGGVVPPLAVRVKLVLAEPDERLVAVRLHDGRLPVLTVALALESVHGALEVVVQILIRDGGRR